MPLGQFVDAHWLLEVWDLSVAETPKRWRTGLTLKQGSGRLGDEDLPWLGRPGETDQSGECRARSGSARIA